MGDLFFGFGKIQDGEMFFKQYPPSREINRFLHWNMGWYTSETDNSTQLRQISRFIFSQLEVAFDNLEAKYTSNVPRGKDGEMQ